MADQAVELESQIRYRYAMNTNNNTNDSDSYNAAEAAVLIREGHLMAVLPLTRNKNEGRVLDDFWLYNQVSAFLAVKHISQRNGTVLPELPDRLKGCDFQWTYQHHDTQFSPLQSVKGLLSYDDKPIKPFAAVGAVRSPVSQLFSVVGAARQLPSISPASSANDLDDQPFFARTCSSNALNSRAMMVYLNSLGVENIGFIYVNDGWGRAYATNFAYYAKEFDVNVQFVAYNLDDDMDKIMQHVASLPVTYMFGAISTATWRSVLSKAFEHKAIGPASNVQWFFSSMNALLSESLVLDAETETDLAQAIHGIGVMTFKRTPHPALDDAIAAFAQDTVLQQEFIQSHTEPHLLENYTFDPGPGRSIYRYLSYDAVIALGITACETPGLFTGAEFWANLMDIDFVGTSGRVNLNATTGTRQSAAFEFELFNFDLQPPSIDLNSQKTVYAFDRRSAAVIDFPDNVGRINLFKPFIYFDDSTRAPPVLPPVEMELNLVPNYVLIVGYTLAGVVLLQSICWGLWVYVNREKYTITASQPIFLYQLCIGTFLIALTIIPLSFQEDMPGLDAACKVTPWFLCIGFCVAMSALLSKSLRINEVMGLGSKLRRMNLEPKDVMKTCLIMMTINIALLAGWTASPFALTWTRINLESFDQYGRSVESNGICRPGGEKPWYLFFLIPLVLVNATVLLLATYHSYKGRNLPTELSETSYLFFSIISLSETALIGSISLIPMSGNPTGFHLVLSLIVFTGCMAILVPMFLPKYWYRNRERPTMQRMTSSIVRSKSQRGLSIDMSRQFELSRQFALSEPFENEETRSGPMRLIRTDMSGSMQPSKSTGPSSSRMRIDRSRFNGSSRPAHLRASSVIPPSGSSGSLIRPFEADLSSRSLGAPVSDSGGPVRTIPAGAEKISEADS